MSRAKPFRSERHCALDALYPTESLSHPIREIPQDLPLTRRTLGCALLIVLATLVLSAIFPWGFA